MRPPASSSIDPRRPAGSGQPRPPCPQRIRHPLPSRPHAPTHVVPARLTADLRSSGHSQLMTLRTLRDKRTRSRASVFSRIRSVGIHTPAPSPTSALDRGRDRGEQETQQRPPGDDRPAVAGIWAVPLLISAFRIRWQSPAARRSAGTGDTRPAYKIGRWFLDALLKMK